MAYDTVDYSRSRHQRIIPSVTRWRDCKGDTFFRSFPLSSPLLIFRQWSICLILLFVGGFGATALGIIPYAGMSFFTYDTLKHLASDYYSKQQQEAQDGAVTASGSDPSKHLPVPVRLLCGALAGAAAQTASYPLDVVRRRMQLYGLSTQLPKYRNTADALISILRNEGIKKLYIGLSINYIKVGPAHAISFVCYEYFKEKLNIK